MSQQDSVSQDINSLSQIGLWCYSAYSFPLNLPNGLVYGNILAMHFDNSTDKYYMALNSNGDVHFGRALNGTDTVTWRTIQHSVSQIENFDVTVNSSVMTSGSATIYKVGNIAQLHISEIAFNANWKTIFTVPDNCKPIRATYAQLFDAGGGTNNAVVSLSASGVLSGYKADSETYSGTITYICSN